MRREGESYDKEFKLLKVGTIKLDKGKGELKLLAKAMIGNRMMDVKSARLRLIKSENL